MHQAEGDAASLTPASTPQDHTCRTAPAAQPRFEEQAEPILETGSPPPTIITEQEVVLSTAAAVAARRTNNRWWSKPTRVVVHSALRFIRSKPDRGQPRQDQPRRYEFLDRSCMGREMDRL
jgi:hypothetical protein